MKVVVVTTSYPRDAGDLAGTFVRDAVEALRREGVEIDVVSPASFRHFGIAYGHGVAGNLRRAPWKLLLVPLFLASFVRVARRAARDADLVHAHWLPTGLIGLATRKPVVVQLWGTDVALAERARWLARPLLRRARLTLVASESLARSAERLGAADVRVVPSGVEIPQHGGAPEEPPHVLFVGRLSAEKGILELVDAARGLPLVVVGDGPLRDRVPEALGFVPPAEVGSFLERAAVVACPSHREGYGVVARQAMAYGRAVVVTRAGGLVDAVDDGETGLVVPVGDVEALRAALQRLLGDGELRRRLGSAARARAGERFGLDAAARATIAAYEHVLHPSS
jgi:glycosyltransferase involved in cell wall biosynthesis